MKPAEDVTQNLTTLSECLNNAVENGYVEHFKISNKHLVMEKGKLTYQPQDISITNFYRYEGYTNPDDNSILFLIKTKDGKKGTLIDAYGAYADAELSNFIRQVNHIGKTTEDFEVHSNLDTSGLNA